VPTATVTAFAVVRPGRQFTLLVGLVGLLPVG